MKLCYRNQDQVVIQIAATEADGSPKTDLTTANVRVYSIVSGSEVDILTTTALVQVGSTSIYRYILEPTTLPIGEYFIEYSLEDADSNTSIQVEDLTVFNTNTWSEFEVIRKIETGRWKIEDDQMIFYDDDGTTELYVFDLFDINGYATTTNVMERTPA